MTQEERRIFLIDYLKHEDSRLEQLELPAGEEEQKRLLRSLMNVRPARPAPPEFMAVQDAYLLEFICGRATLPALPRTVG